MDIIFIRQGEYEKGDAAFPVIRQCVKKYYSALAGEKECEMPDPDIRRTEKGRPYLTGCENAPDISITHSGDIWMCMVSEDRCGIDFQYLRQSGISAVSDRFFTVGEREYIEGGGTGQFTGSFLRTEEGRTGRFFDVWVRRESLGKYGGDGFFGRYPDSAPGGMPAVDLSYNIDSDDKGIYIHDITASMLADAGVHTDGDFRAVCVSGSPDAPVVEKI